SRFPRPQTRVESRRIPFPATLGISEGGIAARQTRPLYRVVYPRIRGTSRLPPSPRTTGPPTRGPVASPDRAACGSSRGSESQTRRASSPHPRRVWWKRNLGVFQSRRRRSAEKKEPHYALRGRQNQDIH